MSCSVAPPASSNGHHASRDVLEVPVRRVPRPPRRRRHPAVERSVVGDDHLLRVAEAEQRQQGLDTCIVRQHVLHAEAVHADGRPRVHQLPQVVQVLAVATVPDDQPLRVDAALPEVLQLISAVLRRGVRVRRDRNARMEVCLRGGVHHATYVVGQAGTVGDHLEHCRADAGVGDADLDVAHEHLHQRIRPADEEPWTVGVEVPREHVGGVVAGRGEQSDLGAGGHLRHPPHVPAQTRAP